MLDIVPPGETARAESSGDWEAKTKNILKAELKRRGIGYKELAERLGAIGIHENEPNIRNKLARGRFTAVFMIQVMAAIGAKSILLGTD